MELVRIVRPQKIFKAHGRQGQNKTASFLGRRVRGQQGPQIDGGGMQANEMGTQHKERLAGVFFGHNHILRELMDAAVRRGGEEIGTPNWGIIGVCDFVGDGAGGFLEWGEERKGIQRGAVGELDRNGVSKLAKRMGEGVVGNQSRSPQKAKKEKSWSRSRGAASARASR